MPGSVHSGSVDWDDCGRKFPDKLRVSPFPDRFSYYASKHADTVAWYIKLSWDRTGLWVERKYGQYFYADFMDNAFCLHNESDDPLIATYIEH